MEIDLGTHHNLSDARKFPEFSIGSNPAVSEQFAVSELIFLTSCTSVRNRVFGLFHKN